MLEVLIDDEVLLVDIEVDVDWLVELVEVLVLEDVLEVDVVKLTVVEVDMDVLDVLVL